MLTYIASPYSHESKITRESRYIAVTKFTMAGLKAGHLVFSPIMYCHPGAELTGMGTKAVDWDDLNRQWMERCDNLLILGIEGWAESVGVREELVYMHEELRHPCYLAKISMQATLDEEALADFWKGNWRLNSHKIKPSVVGGMQMETHRALD